VEAARNHEGQAEVKVFEQMPVEYGPEAARTRRPLGRTGIEQDAVGGPCIIGQGREIGRALDRQRLHHLAAEPPLDLGKARHGLMAVQLQNVGLQRRDDAFERRVVGVHGQRDLDRALLHMLAQLARGLQREVARRRRKEHEADHVGAGLERSVERLPRGQATDFDA
jgi:hypothetical protein